MVAKQSFGSQIAYKSFSRLGIGEKSTVYKSEIRISKSEKNPKYEASNAQNCSRGGPLVSNFEFRSFTIVSYFGFRAPDLETPDSFAAEF
jgi:hypothetical protein